MYLVFTYHTIFRWFLNESDCVTIQKQVRLGHVLTLTRAFVLCLAEKKTLLTKKANLSFLQNILQDMCVELTDYESQMLCDKFDPKKEGR